ncbi:MAG: asparagine synthase (glutamine-hydrolyzing) [Candidatus Electrothrix sp. YB6]
MCGIAGVCGIQSAVYPQTDTIRAMLSAIRHRGPDEAGVYLDDWAALGHCRLSIIDLTGGIQPLSNESGELWITYNGEFFNYPELKGELLKPHTFTTKTDTEVLLHLFEEQGPACLNRLNGQFAFAVWNSKNRELFLARDRVGIRPLFYTVFQDKLVFGSEIKALFQFPEIQREFDPVGLDQIFTFWTTLPGHTAFKGVKELPPGHYLSLKNGHITIQRYWETPFQQPVKSDLDLPSAVEELDALLTDAIRIRLRADVPVGSYLSGGLDSSGITAKIVHNFDNKLSTFGIRFEDQDFDESDFQQVMVRHLQTRHTELTASGRAIADNFPQVIYHAESPMMRTAPVPLFLLSERVRDAGYKVVLTGEGADEFFGGYNIFRENKIRRFWARQPASEMRADLLGTLYPYIFKNQRIKKMLQAFFAKGLQDVDNPFYSHAIRWENTCRIKSFWSEQFRNETAGYDAQEDLRQRLPSGFSSRDALSKAQYLESSLFMSNYLLSTQGDRVAMGHSLEIRLPFLDYRVLDYLAGIPARWKISGIQEKFILKKIFAKELPTKIVQRPKHPYRAPIAKALLGHDDSPAVDSINEKTIKDAGLFDFNKISLLTKKVQKSSQISELDNMAFCLIVSTQLLYQQFIKGNCTFGSTEPYHVDLVIDKRTCATC